MHKCATSVAYHRHVATHQRPRRRAATTTTAIGDTQDTPHHHRRPGTAPASCRRVRRRLRGVGPRPTSDDRNDTTPPRQRRSERTQHTPYVHRPPGPKALALRTSARCRLPNAQPHAPQPPTPTTARNRPRNPGEPTPPPLTTLHRAAMPRRRTQAHNVGRARRRTDDSDDGALRRRQPRTPHARGPSSALSTTPSTGPRPRHRTIERTPTAQGTRAAHNDDGSAQRCDDADGCSGMAKGCSGAGTGHGNA